MKPDYIMIGLGNPGDQYEKTRHNAGWIMLDYLAFESGFSYQKHLSSWVATGMFGGAQWMLIKPDMYMNESGRVIGLLKKHFDITGDRLVVVHDDVDLPIGTMKFSYDRGSGGHNGIKSLIEHYGDTAFMRFRVGIAQTHDERTVKPDVLGIFHPDELKQLQTVGAYLEKLCQLIGTVGYAKAQAEHVQLLTPKNP